MFYPRVFLTVGASCPFSITGYTVFESTNYDVAIRVARRETGLYALDAVYDSETCPTEAVRRMMEHLVNIVNTIIGNENPLQTVDGIDMLSEEEKRLLMVDFNAMDLEYPTDKTIHGLFETQAAQTPDSIALVDPGTFNLHLSFNELNSISCGLANILLEKGIKTGSLVGLTAGRNSRMIIGIIGILKTGACYIPLNPKAPAARNLFILRDCDAKHLLIDDTAGIPVEFNEGLNAIDIIPIQPTDVPRSGQLPLPAVEPGSNAYIIYTSGSTGLPKGVLITHSNFSPLIHWCYNHLRFDPGDRAAQNLSYYFDWSVMEIFISLTSGASLYMVPETTIIDAAQYVNYLDKYCITVLHITPTHFQALANVSLDRGQKLTSMKHLCIGAEKLSYDLAMRSFEMVENSCRVYNMYGPTETTIVAAVLELFKPNLHSYKELSGIPIGRTLGNTFLYILDRDMHPTPVYVCGELYIAGDSVAQGYINRPELTRGSFVKPPLDPAKLHCVGEHLQCLDIGTSLDLFVDSVDIDNTLPNNNNPTKSFWSHLFTKRWAAGGSLYKTGDLCRWLADGIIEFLGRIDHQIKIRGFRIEPGEIENRLMTHPAVKDALVIAKQDNNGENYLCAYVVLSAQVNFLTHELHELNEFKEKGDSQAPLRGDLLWRQAPSSGFLNGQPLHEKELSIINYQLSINNENRKGDSQVIAELKHHLSQSLPDYMVPSYFIMLDRMPLNPNGKVDLKALPSPDAGISTGRNYEPPTNDIEKKLVEIWAKILSREAGIDDDFFEMGGHSLNVTRLAGSIYKEFKIEIPFTQFFINPTIRELAQYILQNTSLINEYKKKEAEIEIPLTEEKEYYPLSSAQKRLYVLQMMDPQSTIYNIFGFMTIEGDIDIEKFTRVFHRLIQRHESFRTSFRVIGHEPVQVIEAWTSQGCNPLAKAFDIDRSSFSNLIKPFDLSKAPLIRMSLTELTPGKHILMLDMHHIISDGTSLGVLVKEFMDLYENKELALSRLRYRDYVAWSESETERLRIKNQEVFWLKQLEGELPLLYLPMDFTRPVAQVFEGAHIPFELDTTPTLGLKSLAARQGTTLFTVLTAMFNILLSKLSGQEDIIIGTPVSGRRHPDLQHIVGMFVNTLAVRLFPTGSLSFDMFIDETKTRVSQAFENQEYPFEDLVEKISTKRDASRNPVFDVMLAMQNLDIPSLQIPGLTLRPFSYDNKISKFDLVFICETDEKNGKLQFTAEYCTKLFKETTITRYISYFKKIISEITAGTSIAIGSVEIISQEEKHQILYEFNNFEDEYEQNKTIPALFEEQAGRTPDRIAVVETGSQAVSFQMIDRLASDFARLLIKKGVQPGQPVGIMSHKSIAMIVGIIGILKTGGAYVPLNPKAPTARNRFMLDECAVKILAVQANLKTPGIETQFSDGLEWIEIETIIHESIAGEFQSLHHIPLPTVMPDSLAYVIFTSGSTGQPKGVAISHSNFCQLVHWGYRHLALTPSDRALQNLSYYFDWSVWEIFIILTTGGSLHMVPGEILMNPAACVDYILTHSLTVLHVTPTQYQYITHTPSKPLSLKHLFIGAEKLTYDLVKRSFDSVTEVCRVYNMYGPTEATIISAVLEIDRNNYEVYRTLTSVPIGKPTGNTNLFILDKYFNLCPIDIPGELFITGGGLSRGYINNPELTRGSFCKNRPWTPQKLLLKGGGAFVEIAERADTLCPSVTSVAKYEKGDRQENSYENIPSLTNDSASLGVRARHAWPLNQSFNSSLINHHSSLYKTGDLCRWLADGTIEYLGRIDLQVKIRGFRIELGEIENRLLAHNDIKEAVVIDRTNSHGEKYLCAYVVFHPNRVGVELKRYLSESLPDYMIPSYFVSIDRIPLNPNGKVDRKALPDPADIAVPGAKKSIAGPSNPIEKQLADIWASVLNRHKDDAVIGIDDNFFDIGGHSLKAALVISKIHETFNVKLKLTEIFINPTIRQLAEVIHDNSSSTQHFHSIEPTPEQDYYILSPAQERLFLLYKIDPYGVGYNIPVFFEIQGEIQVEKWNQVFKRLIHRHESLRTSFHMIDNNPVQKIHPDTPFEVEIVSPSTEPGTPGEDIPDITRITHAFIRPFDLSKPPLLRAGLLSQGNNKNLLMVDMHHIISDGTSTAVLVEDFMALYNNNALPETKTRYRDYAVWQHKRREDDFIKNQETFWLNRFKGDIPVLNCPYDFPRPQFQSFEGQTFHFQLETEQLSRLNIIASQHNATLYMVLLSLFNIFLSKISGQEDIIVGTPVAGRVHPDIQRVIGMFVNTLAMRNAPRPAVTFTDFLEDVKKQTIDAFENQDIQFETLVEKVDIKRDPSRNPLFDAMFILQNVSIPRLEVPGLILQPYIVESRIAKFDLTLTCEEKEVEKEVVNESAGDGIENNRVLHCSFEFCSKLFKPETIHRYIEFFKRIVQTVLDHKDIVLSDISLVNSFEQEQLLYTFNDTRRDWPLERTVIGFFEDRAEQTPDRIAIVGPSLCNSQETAASPRFYHFTYKEFQTVTRSLGSLLRQKGTGPGTIVGICMDRSIEMVLSIFGILIAGGAYLPIDTQYPAERIDYIMKDSAARLLLTSKPNESYETETLEFQALFQTPREEAGPGCKLPVIEDSPTVPAFDSSNLAYIIYTSGSTGRPKGVMIEHRSAANTITALHERYPLDAEDTYLLKTAYVFDVSVAELFGWFPGGGRLAILPKNGEKDPAEIARTAQRECVTHINFVPSMFRAFVEVLTMHPHLIPNISCLKYIFLAGEALTGDIVTEFRRLNPTITLENIYGPTEAAVYGSWFSLSDWNGSDRIPIGKPLYNVQLYILDKNYHPQPIGVPGELFIGGAGIARGYLNRPELSNERFILKTKTLFGKRVLDSQKLFIINKSFYGVQGRFLQKEPLGLYKTGDLVRWLEDGNIEFYGRIDHQVKVRGFRVELEEIERVLLRHEAVKEAAVTVRGEEKKSGYLCAYVVFQEAWKSRESSAALSPVKEYLVRVLPGYMVPSQFVVLEQMPLTATGKIDRKHLPGPESKTNRGKGPGLSAAPATELEAIIAKHCAEVLKLDSVGVEDNFFDLGGNSLDIIRLAGKLSGELGKEVAVVKFFNYPTVRMLAQHLGFDKNAALSQKAQEEEKKGLEIQKLDIARDKKKRAAELMRRKRE